MGRNLTDADRQARKDNYRDALVETLSNRTASRELFTGGDAFGWRMRQDPEFRRSIVTAIAHKALDDVEYGDRLLAKIVRHIGQARSLGVTDQVRVIPRFNPWSPELTAEIEAGRVAWGP